MKAIKDRGRLQGRFVVEHYRNGKLLGISETIPHNLIYNAGLDHFLNSMFHNDASATWYVLLYNTNTTPQAAHTYASKSFTEDVDYDEATRPEYEEAAASSQSMTNAANKATFTITTGGQTIYGCALVDNNTKGDSAAGGAVMACGGLISPARLVAAADVLNVTYVISQADDGV
uniref:Uncharacterized protein n=1 Tax=viral metagenome TaxID=1070528 RepID=A0A6M3M3Y3_9ZZZZ